MVEELIEGAVDAPHVLQPQVLTLELGSSHARVRFQFDVARGRRGHVADREGRLLLQIS